MIFSGHDDSTINIVLGLLLLLLLLLVTQVELILVEFWITAVCLEFVDSKHTHNNLVHFCCQQYRSMITLCRVATWP